MNKFFLILLLFSLAACANSQEEKTPLTKQEIATPPPPPASTMQHTKLTEEQKKNLPTNYVVENTRQANQINAAYPYDIGLKTADGKVAKSSTILAKNGKPTVLMFWLTTCVPCRYEMKAVHEKYEGWQQEEDFNLYAISTDFEKT